MMRASSFAILAATVFASPVAAQSLHVGLDSAADFTPIYETDELPGYIKEFVVSVDYSPTPPKSIHAKVIAVDVGNAAPPNTVVNEVEHPLQTGESRSSLRWSLPREFPLGIYRVDVEDLRPIPIPHQALAALRDLLEAFTIFGASAARRRWTDTQNRGL